MSRSRRLLLAAWGLLLVGSIIHFVIPGEDAEVADTAASDESSSKESDRAPDQLAFGDDVSRGSQRASGSLDAVDETAVADGTLDAEDAETAPAETVPPEPVESFVALVTGDGIASSTEPGGPATGHWFPNPTQFGSERAFLVVDQTSSLEYVKVALPIKPNGQEGWIPRAEVEIRPVNHRAVINLTDDSVTVWDGDQVIVETKAVTGKPATPTPVGTFYVRDIITQANAGGSYGPYIVALSGFSEVLDTFNGGLPALAIHGTNRPEQIGTERSSGCIRIPNDLISLVAESVPLGTPVTIVA